MSNNLEKDRREKRGGTIRFLLFLALVMLMLGGSSVYMRLMPDETYSSSERRMLSKRPKLSKKTVMRGRFQRKYEVYLSEQFPGREHWVALQTKLSRLIGNKDANGVYFGKDHYLLEQYKEQDFDWKKAEENIKYTAEFLQEYPNANVMFVPVKSSVMADKLPMFAEITGEQRFFDLVSQQIPAEQQIEVESVLKEHDAEYIYYRTDHHWTTLGAYYAYEQWAEKMGLSAISRSDYTITDVTDTFLGTTYAKVRTGGLADTISLYERKDGADFQLDYNMGEFESGSFYDLTKVEGDDPYSVFFGGNQAFIDIRADLSETVRDSSKNQAEIETVDSGKDQAESGTVQDSSKNQAERKRENDQAGKKGQAKARKDKVKKQSGKTLMIIKDSFGNCFAPLAASHYARTIVVDLRSVNIPVGKLLKVYPADDILLLYNSVQFMEDDNIVKLK